MKNLDKLDRRLLYELDLNGRVTFAVLSRRLRKSKQVVDYRIKRLQRLGIIKGFATVIDHSKLGYFSIRVYIKLRNISPEKRLEFEEYCLSNKDVWWFVLVDGAWDFDLVILVKDIYEFYPIWDGITSRFQKYMLKHEITIYTHIQRFPKSYLIGEPNQDQGITISAECKVLPIDEFDKKILKEISLDCRFNLLELSAKVGLNVQTVRSRIALMEKRGIIAGYQALIDLNALGYKFYKSFLYLTDATRVKEMRAFALSHPNIIFLNRNIGGADFEMEFHVRGIEEFNLVMQQFMDEFYDAVDHYYYFRVIAEPKFVYTPKKLFPPQSFIQQGQM